MLGGFILVNVHSCVHVVAVQGSMQPSGWVAMPGMDELDHFGKLLLIRIERPIHFRHEVIDLGLLEWLTTLKKSVFAFRMGMQPILSSFIVQRGIRYYTSFTFVPICGHSDFLLVCL